MAVLFKNEEGQLICHETFIERTYTDFKYKNVFFDLRTPFRMDLEAEAAARSMEDPELSAQRRKRKKSSSRQLDLVSENIKQKFGNFILTAKSKGLITGNVSSLEVRENNREARQAVRDFLSQPGLLNLFQDSFYGSNDSNKIAKFEHYNENFIIPANSEFFNDDVSCLKNLVSEKRMFSLIVIDPPWMNKFVKRRKKTNVNTGYDLMENDDLRNLPVAELCEDETLVALWCTNSQKHIEFAKSTLFPEWKLNLVAEWFWVKVTTHGEPVICWNASSGKLPYERLLLARRKTSESKLPDPEDGKLIVSIPSAIHSFKPPLLEVLKPYTKDELSHLEIFARSLVPGGTSVGNQVLLLQHESLFQKSNNTNI